MPSFIIFAAIKTPLIYFSYLHPPPYTLNILLPNYALVLFIKVLQEHAGHFLYSKEYCAPQTEQTLIFLFFTPHGLQNFGLIQPFFSSSWQ
jgi:hypothetical protein